MIVAALAAFAIALSDWAPAAAAAPVIASGSDQPEARRCVGAEEAGVRVADDGNEDEGAPSKFSAAFYRHSFTLDASLDGLDGKQLPISIEEVCDVPRALAKQATQLAGTDGVALLSARTRVWLDRTPLQGDAAVTALGGADTAELRVHLAARRRWAEDEDGDKVTTFTARRITITD
jgi:hypothetical protein